MLSDEQRAAMRSTLSAERGKKVWFVRQPNDPEVDAFQSELEAVFLESGWAIAGNSEAQATGSRRAFTCTWRTTSRRLMSRPP